MTSWGRGAEVKPREWISVERFFFLEHELNFLLGDSKAVDG